MANGFAAAAATKTWTWFGDAWRDGNTPIMGPRTHGSWLASTVFDGARVVDGAAPDIDLHFERVNHSAREVRLEPMVPVTRWLELAREGIAKFDGATALYIRPMYWAEDGVGGGVRYEPSSTNWCLSIYEALMPPPKGSSITLSPYRRPTPDSAPLSAKASCLYPNNARALMEAFDRGFDNCVLRDADGFVAELANANLFMVKNGIVHTPIPNGTFLDGITRRRVISLLREAGLTIQERSIAYEEFQAADEIFSTGNYLKVYPMIQIEDRRIEPGPVYRTARDLYWDFAHKHYSLGKF